MHKVYHRVDIWVNIWTRIDHRVNIWTRIDHRVDIWTRIDHRVDIWTRIDHRVNIVENLLDKHSTSYSKMRHRYYCQPFPVHPMTIYDRTN